MQRKAKDDHGIIVFFFCRMRKVVEVYHPTVAVPAAVEEEEGVGEEGVTS